MNAAGKITIITAVINAAGPLAVTIASVIPFLSERVEYIIVDGGSDDGTLEIIKQHESQLKSWVSEPDKGVYDAMNKGWALADEDHWILFLGAGDRLLALPEELPGDSSEKTVLFGHVQLSEDQQFHARSGFWLKLYNSLHHQSLLVPKRLHPEPPFSLQYPLYADFDFNQRLARMGVHFMFCKELFGYAEPDGLTQETNLDELQRIIQKNYGVFWSMLSFACFRLALLVPSLRRFRPIH
jgi:glycosyltransferase involved in cell wall biosynthesis